MPAVGRASVDSRPLRRVLSDYLGWLAAYLVVLVVTRALIGSSDTLSVLDENVLPDLIRGDTQKSSTEELLHWGKTT